MSPKLEDLMPPTATEERRSIDWDRVAKAAIGSAVLAGLISGTAQIVGQWLADRARPQQKAQRPNTSTRDDDQTEEDFLSIDDALSAAARGSVVPADVANAAALLNVDPLRATQAEVRRAMRARIANDGAHPDHGGDAQQTRTLIEARDRLLAFLGENSQ
jgi:hypothetical protein